MLDAFVGHDSPHEEDDRDFGRNTEFGPDRRAVHVRPKTTVVHRVRNHARVVPPDRPARRGVGPRRHNDLVRVPEGVCPEASTIDGFDDRTEGGRQLDVAVVRDDVRNPAFRRDRTGIVRCERRRRVRVDDVRRQGAEAPAHSRRDRGLHEDEPRPHADDPEAIHRLFGRQRTIVLGRDDRHLVPAAGEFPRERPDVALHASEMRREPGGHLGDPHARHLRRSGSAARCFPARGPPGQGRTLPRRWYPRRSTR